MKKILIIIMICAMGAGAYAQNNKPAMQIADNSFFDPTRKPEKEESYQFGVEYRIEAGFVQHQQQSKNLTYPDLLLHGARLGATFTFKLPANFGLQTGLLYTILFGQNEQHWRSMDAPSVQNEYIRHRVLEHNFTIPVRAFYIIPVWRKLNLFVYAGPQLHIGLAENDYMQTHLSEGTKTWLEGQGIATEPYDRFADELIRANIQMGLGGGIEWDCYRLQGGYDFGLNNQVIHKTDINRHMWEWGWHVSFSYKL